RDPVAIVLLERDGLAQIVVLAVENPPVRAVGLARLCALLDRYLPITPVVEAERYPNRGPVSWELRDLRQVAVAYSAVVVKVGAGLDHVRRRGVVVWRPVFAGGGIVGANPGTDRAAQPIVDRPRDCAGGHLRPIAAATFVITDQSG